MELVSPVFIEKKIPLCLLGVVPQSSKSIGYRNLSVKRMSVIVKTDRFGRRLLCARREQKFQNSTSHSVRPCYVCSKVSGQVTVAAGMPNLYRTLKVPVLRQTCLPPIETNCIHDFVNKTNDGTGEVWQIRMIESSVILQFPSVLAPIDNVRKTDLPSRWEICDSRRLKLTFSDSIYFMNARKNEVFHLLLTSTTFAKVVRISFNFIGFKFNGLLLNPKIICE